MFTKTDGAADVSNNRRSSRCFKQQTATQQTVDRLAPRLADSFVWLSSGLITTTAVDFGGLNLGLARFFAREPLIKGVAPIQTVKDLTCTGSRTSHRYIKHE